MEKIEFAVLAGDGNGPDIVAHTINLLQTLERYMELRFDFHYELIGEAGLKISKKTLPKESLKLCRDSDAVLIGSLNRAFNPETPRDKSSLEALKILRKALGIYCEIRPVRFFIQKPHSESRNPFQGPFHDLKIFRETSGGISFPDKGRKNQGSTAYDTLSYSDNQIKRISRLVFKESMNLDRRIWLVDHIESMETSLLWRESVRALEKEFPEISVSYLDIKDILKGIVKSPEKYTYILVENLLGEVLTTQAELNAGLYLGLPSLFMGPASVIFDSNSYPLVQPLHKEKINPLPSYLTTALILDHYGHSALAELIRLQVFSLMSENPSLNGPFLEENQSTSTLSQKFHNFLISEIKK